MQNVLSGYQQYHQTQEEESNVPPSLLQEPPARTVYMESDIIGASLLAQATYPTVSVMRPPPNIYLESEAKT